MRFSKLKFGARLGLGFSVVLLLMLVMAAFGSARVTRVIDLNREIADRSQRYSLAAQWRADTRLNLTRTLALAKSGDQPALHEYLKGQMDKTSAQIAERQKKLEATVLDEEDKSRMTRIAERRKAYIAIRDSILAQMKSGDEDGAQVRIETEMIPASQNYLDAIDALESSLQADLQAASPLLEEDARATRTWLLVLTAAAVVAGALVSWAITRSITVPMRRAIGTAQRVAGGDLSQVLVQHGGTDEVSQLENALAAMQEQLRDVVLRIRGATDEVSAASRQIAAGSNDLSRRSEQAASDLEETAASVEQLTGAARNTASTAHEANELMHTASEVASRGGGAVSQVVATMDQISAASRKIVDIIGVIDAIAFQTNILALNAAVESARAGEQGRGFAVVAAEVRALAQRSAAAAREIKGLIADSVDKVDSGSRQVQDAGQTMREIVANVERVAAMIGEISDSTREQQSGFDQVNGAVSHLDNMTQQNAALVEQSAAAAQSLQHQAQALADAVLVFRIDRAEAQAA